MNIQELKIENFKCFTERSFRFQPQFNIVIGDNGAGKTALLDAVSVALGSFFLGFDRVATRTIQPDEIRRSLSLDHEAPELRLHYPARVEVDATVGGQPVRWARELRGEGRHTTHGEAANVRALAQKLLADSRNGVEVILPLISYYGTWRAYRQKVTWKTSTLKPGERARGYADCLTAASNVELLLKWFKTMELGALQRGKPSPTLEGVRECLAVCMDEWSHVFHDVLMDELVAEKQGGEKLPVRLLSDGQRTSLFMVLDIAHRAATLNPHLQNASSAETPGVVLIDEIDLHLHPRWQRRVVEDLRTAFPRLQFIATSHSPSIIQSARSAEVLNLDPDAGPTPSPAGSPEDILENLMGVSLPPIHAADGITGSLGCR